MVVKFIKAQLSEDMMNQVPEFQTHRHPLEQESVLATNKVLRNTYLLLSMTLAFSAACTVMGMSLSYGWSMGCLLGGFVMSFVVRANANSSMGLIAIFAFAGLFGAAIGPMINTYLTVYSNGIPARLPSCVPNGEHLCRFRICT